MKRELMRGAGFTLAEVLITLGIIGVVAAMTLPTLIEKHQKKVVVTRLQKFYTNINQAVKLSEVDNGSYEYWDYPQADLESHRAFYDKYFAKYLKTYSVGTYSESVKNDDGTIQDGQFYDFLVIKFADGSGMLMRTDGNGTDIAFYPYASKIGKSTDNRSSFSFAFNKINSVGKRAFVEPYTFGWDGTREHLLSHPRYGCKKSLVANSYCARLIQYDGWEIKDDYPW